MDEELVLLTSYFNLANGRRQDNADTFRVDPEVPSATSADGTAALYILTEASAAGNMGPRARRLAADTIAWEYQTHGDEPPAARIRLACKVAHEAVMQEFDGHVAVGISVIAVEEDTIYLGQVTPAQVYVLHEGSLHSLTASASGSAPFAQAIGSRSGPKIQVFKDQIGAGDVVAICSSWFRRALDADELRESFAAGTADDIIDSLLQLAKMHDATDATAIVIEAVPASELEGGPESEVPSFLEQVDGAVQALAGVGKLLWSELRAVPSAGSPNGHGAQPVHRSERESATLVPRESAPVEPPASVGGRGDALPSGEQSVAPAAAGRSEMAAQEYEAVDDLEQPVSESTEAELDALHHQMTEEVPIVTAETENVIAVPADRSDTVEIGEPPPNEPVRERVKRPRSKRGSEAVPEPQSRRAVESLSELEQVNSRLQEGPDMGEVIPPVQAFPDTSTVQPERIYATSKELRAANRRPRRFGGIVRPAGRDSPSSPAIIRPSLGALDLDRPTSRNAPPALIWLGIAAVFVLAALAFYVYYKHHHTVATNPYPALVSTDLRKANAATSAASQDTYLSLARHNLASAIETGADPTTVRKLRHRLQLTSDRLHLVTRVVNPITLADFSKTPGAQASQIATAPGLVYVLDTGQKKVLSYSTIPGSGPTSIAQSGEQDSGLTVGAPQQIATDGTTALVLDDHNTLIRYANGTKTATTLTEPDQNERIVGMATEDPDVYLLDPAHNQVWRYPFAVTNYNPTAESYFVSTPPNLSGATAFTMDGLDLYVLLTNGHVLKFDNQANQQPFADALRTPMLNPVSISTAPNLKDLWIADPAHGRIVQLDKTGKYLRSYMSGTSGLNFHDVKDAVIGPAGNTLYVLVGTKLIDFSVKQ